MSGFPDFGSSFEEPTKTKDKEKAKVCKRIRILEQINEELDHYKVY